MKHLIFLLAVSALLKLSSQTCTSSAAVTNCINEVLKRNQPLKIQNYKPFLDLHKNNLEEVPYGSFENLPKVTILHLSFNKIKNIEDDSFKGLVNLKHLSLYDNKLTEVGDVFKHNPNLEILSLGMNKINSINEKAFLNLQKLKELDLSFNELTTIPSGINNLINLELLDLHYNKINTIPDKLFENFNKLKELKLSDNKLTQIKNSDFKGLSKLEKLDLSFNLISKMDIDKILQDMPSLTYLKLGLNSFTCNDLDHIVRALKRKRIEVPRGNTKKRDNVDGMYCTK